MELIVFPGTCAPDDWVTDADVATAPLSDADRFSMLRNYPEFALVPLALI